RITVSAGRGSTTASRNQMERSLMARSTPNSRVMNDLERPDVAPRVAMPSRPWTVPAAFACAVALGGVVFLELNANRTRTANAEETVHVVPPPPAPAPPAQPPAAPAVETPAATPPATTDAAQHTDRSARLAARAMIVDLSDPQTDAQATPSAGAQVS